jgi:hypothetical protein
VTARLSQLPRRNVSGVKGMMLVSRAILSLIRLREAGLEAYDLNALVFYEKPLLKFERSLETYLYSAPMLVWLKEKLNLRHLKCLTD